MLNNKYNVYADKILVGTTEKLHGYWYSDSVVENVKTQMSVMLEWAIEDLCRSYSPVIDKTFKITLEPELGSGPVKVAKLPLLDQQYDDPDVDR